MEVFQALALAVGAGGEVVEVEAVEGLAEALLEGVPELHLAPGQAGEELQLDDAAERGAAADAAVQLEAAEALGDLCEDRFDGVATYLEVLHQAHQGVVVGLDL